MTKSSQVKYPIKQHIGGVFVIVSNMPRAVEWYREILGLPRDEPFLNQADPNMKTIYSIPLGKTSLILDSIHRDTLQPSSNHLFILDTDDIQESYNFIKSKKVEILTEIEGENGVRFFTIKDSEGNHLMICQEDSSGAHGTD